MQNTPPYTTKGCNSQQRFIVAYYCQGTTGIANVQYFLGWQLLRLHGVGIEETLLKLIVHKDQKIVKGQREKKNMSIIGGPLFSPWTGFIIAPYTKKNNRKMGGKKGRGSQ